jgi:hypothetical protein
MEMLRALSQSPPLKHPILFQFTGAEETLLQGSHGFASTHRWGKRVRTFIAGIPGIDSAPALCSLLLLRACACALGEIATRRSNRAH